MKPCKTFIQDDRTTSATKCRNCGCEMWEHNNGYANLDTKEVNKHLDYFFKKVFTEKDQMLRVINMWVGDEESVKLFDKMLKEEMEKSAFTTTSKYFIDENKREK